MARHRRIGMGWQQASSLAVVAVAAVLMIRGMVRKRRQGAGGHCCDGCSMNVDKVDGKPYH